MNIASKNTKSIAILIFTLVFFNVLEAQDQWGLKTLNWKSRGHSAWLDFFSEEPWGEKSFALLADTAPGTPVYYRTKPGDAWIEIPEQGHLKGTGRWISELIFERTNQLQFKCEAGHDFQIFRQFAKSGKKFIDNQVRRCGCDSVKLRTRRIWCPDGSCPPDPSPTPNLEEFLIVHHSAGATEASDFDAVVRSYYRFHVEGNGWDDIGYNYLVSPDGHVYEGRGDFVLGAHFCRTNSNTAGICLIGNYVDRFPSQESLSKLTELLAYKSCQIGINPEGESFHNSSDRSLMRLSGHRDGCATACPGQMLYDHLPILRTDVLDRTQDSCFQLETPILRLESVAGNEANISWTDPYRNESGYFIELSVGDNNDFNYVEDVPANTRQSVITIGNDLPVFVRIRASFNGIPGPYSNVVSSEFTGLSEAQLRNKHKLKCQIIDRLGRTRYTGTLNEMENILRTEGRPEWLLYCPERN